MHEILTLEHFSRWNVRLNVALANRFATRILANSEATAKAFRAWGGREDGVHVVHCGFDPDLYEDPDAAGIASIRSAMGLGSGPLLGLFGRITSGKGHHVLIEALPSLPGVAVLVAGEVEDEAYPRRLRERAEALGVAHRVHFAGFRTDVPRLMQVVDVVVQPSLFEESFGRVVVEGMLAGRPVVASRSGGVVEIVDDGVTGLLVRPGDAGELATAIARLLADPTFARGLAAAGRASARSRFGLDAMLGAVGRHLDEIARRGSTVTQRPTASR